MSLACTNPVDVKTPILILVIALTIVNLKVLATVGLRLLATYDDDWNPALGSNDVTPPPNSSPV